MERTSSDSKAETENSSGKVHTQLLQTDRYLQLIYSWYSILVIRANKTHMHKLSHCENAKHFLPDKVGNTAESDYNHPTPQPLNLKEQPPVGKLNHMATTNAGNLITKLSSLSQSLTDFYNYMFHPLLGSSLDKKTKQKHNQ